MRMKITENKNGTWSLYNQTDKRFIIENGTKKEVDELKKQIDQLRRDRNALNRGIR